MGLKPSARGAGLGRELIKAVLARAYEQPAAHRVWLDAKADNHRALALQLASG